MTNITPERQEKVFKWAFPKKCWHRFHVDQIRPTIFINFAECKFCQSQHSNPSLTSNDGMGLILERLDELNLDWTMNNIDGAKEYGDYRFQIFNFNRDNHYLGISEYADTPPLAVFLAVEKLMEGENDE